MLGAAKQCPNCTATAFKRTPRSRATQCTVCEFILEERARSSLPEYHVVASSEELHCAVTPDLRGDELAASYVPDDDDPFATAGFISAFRLLSPLREPVYGATSNTMAGSLAEMERVLGDAVHETGNVIGERRADARHRVAQRQRDAVTGYFEIVDLADLLNVDWETVILASQLFVRTSNIISMRNKSIEALSAACLHLALELRHSSHHHWLASNPGGHGHGDVGAEVSVDCHEEDGRGGGGDGRTKSAFDPASITPTPESISIEMLASTAFASVVEIRKDLRLVHSVHVGDGLLQSPRDEDQSRVTAKSTVVEGVPPSSAGLSRACAASFERVPEFARGLGLDDEGVALAVGIVEKSFRLNVCPRRAPASVAAAGMYLATQISGLRLTQSEVCLVLKVTEVTLRKVYRELCESVSQVVPEGASVRDVHPQKGPRRNSGVKVAQTAAGQVTPEAVQESAAVNGAAATTERGEQVPHNEANVAAIDHVGDEGLVSPVSLSPDKSDSVQVDVAGSDESSCDAKAQTKGCPNSNEPSTESPRTSGALNNVNEQQRQMMVAMMQNPAVAQAFASAMTTAGLMPSLVPPPPPPPLPVLASSTGKEKVEVRAHHEQEENLRNSASGAVPDPDVVKAALLEAFETQKLAQTTNLEAGQSGDGLDEPSAAINQ